MWERLGGQDQRRDLSSGVIVRLVPGAAMARGERPRSDTCLTDHGQVGVIVGLRKDHGKAGYEVVISRDSAGVAWTSRVA